MGDTLRSLFNQTLPAQNIIVVDDESDVGTAEAVLEMLKLEEAEMLKIEFGVRVEKHFLKNRHKYSKKQG